MSGWRIWRHNDCQACQERFDMPTPEFADALTSLHHWLVVLITLVSVAACVGMHYEILETLNRRMPMWRLRNHPRILVMIFCLLGAHVIEIWVFGLGLYGALQIESMGAIAGIGPVRLLDAVYLSATTFTTLGYGDLVPSGPIRFFMGTESLVGLVLITWSASFAYLEMQRFWRTV